MSEGSRAAHNLIFFVICFLCFSYNEPTSCRFWHIVQISFFSFCAGLWIKYTIGLNKPTPQEEQQRQQQLEEALPLAGNTGVTQQWYTQAGILLSKVELSVMIVIIAIIIHYFLLSYPDSSLNYLHNRLLDGWEYLHDNYTEQELFVYGTWIIDFVVFWSIGLLYIILDFLRPWIFLPFKIQEGWVLTKDMFLKAVYVALRNQFCQLIFMYILWKIYPLLSPNGFSRTLPSFMNIIIHLLGSQPLTEIWFYTTHRFMHNHDWFWSHIHYIHHEWTSPISITCIYAHWAEHIFCNISSVMIGPFLFGSHIVVWWLYSIIALLATLMGHSGWHLPWIQGSESHDYHHATGLGNFGNMGIMDAYFNTNQWFISSWQYQVDHNYHTQDYPVDKILASNHITANTNTNTIKKDIDEGNTTPGL